MGKPKKPCYFCGARSTSAEHVPPKQIFKGFDVDRITAPACDQHNTAKSGEDDAIVKVMATSLLETGQQYKRHPDVVNWVQQIEPHLDRVKRTVTSHQFLRDPPPGLGLKIGHLAGSVGLELWMTKLTAALVHHGIKRFDPSLKWGEAGVYCPEWVNVPPGSVDNSVAYEKLVENFAWAERFEDADWLGGWPSGPRDYPQQLYNFKVALRQKDRLVTFRHHFFQSFRWFVLFYASESTFAKLKTRLV